jgi:hypothetical protein
MRVENIGRKPREPDIMPDGMIGWLSEHFDELYRAFVRRFFSDATPERFLRCAENYVSSKDD